MLALVAGSGSGSGKLELRKKIEIPLILGGYRSAVTACADVKAP